MSQMRAPSAADRDEHDREDVLADLRSSFDAVFSRPRAPRVATGENFLAIRVAEHPYLMRVSEIASLHVRRPTVAVPSSLPELLGLASFRGVVAPVYDLRALLGHHGSSAPAWLVLLRAQELVGFAFDLFERHVNVSAEAVSKGPQGESVRLENQEVRPVIPAASLLEALERRVGALPKES